MLCFLYLFVSYLWRRHEPPPWVNPLALVSHGWHLEKGQGRETVSDARVLEDQTPCSYNAYYVLGGRMFSYLLEGALEHSIF